MIACGPGVVAAEPAFEPAALRPAITSRGWQVALTGYLQVDSIAWSQASLDELAPSGQPLNQERFLIRRGRIRVEARRDAITSAIELDGNTNDGATARLLSAQVGWSLIPAGQGAPVIALTAGLFKTPFGVEVPASERDKAFLEPPAFARGLFPGNYDAGVMAHGSYGLVRYTIAMVNGSPAGDQQWKGKDPSGSYDLVGRIGAVIDGPRKLRVAAGVSAITGTGLHPGDPPTKDDIQWVDENQNGTVEPNELQVVPGKPGTPSETFDRDALGADVQVSWCLCKLGNGAAFAEGVLATNLDRGLVYADPVAADRDLRHAGFAIGVVQELGRYAQAGVRYDRYAVDRDANEREGVVNVGVDKVVSTVAVMAAGRWRDARFVVQYDHERNPFGRSDSGQPATVTSDRLTLRAQVGF